MKPIVLCILCGFFVCLGFLLMEKGRFSCSAQEGKSVPSYPILVKSKSSPDMEF